jgi:hypothetical protein
MLIVPESGHPCQAMNEPNYQLSGNHPTDGSYTIEHMFEDSEITRAARRVLQENLRALMDYYAAHPRMGRAGSGKQLENFSGVSNTTVSRYAPHQGPATAGANIDHLARIAAAYGLPVWCLLYPGLNPAKPPVVQTPEEAAKNRLILEAAAKLLLTGGVNVGIAPGDTGEDRGLPADRSVPGGGPNYKAGHTKP